MPQFIGMLDNLAPGKMTFDQVPSDGIRAIIIGNDSGFNVVVFVGGTGHSKTLYPGSVDIFYVYSGFNGTLTFLITNPLSNQSSYPANYLQFDTVGINEKINESAYPMPFTRAVNTGNASQPTVTNFLQSDNAPIGTQFLEVTPSGAASSTFSMLNDGTVIIKGDIAGALTSLIQTIPGAAAGASSVQLGDSARQVEILGLSQFDGKTTLGANAQLFTPQPVAVQTLNNNSTITLPVGLIKRVTNAGAVTGIIMTAGTIGQFVLIVNEGTNSLTMAAAGSNCRRGSNLVIAPGNMSWLWFNGDNLWYSMDAA